MIKAQSKVFEKVYRSLERNPKLLQTTLKNSFEVKLLDGQDTIVFQIDEERISNYFKMLSNGIYYKEYNKKYQKNWYIVDETSAIMTPASIEDLDIEANIRNFMRQITFAPVSVKNPEVFQYGKFIENDKIIYKYLFYEAIVFYAYTII